MLDWGRALLAVVMGGGKTVITAAVIEELLDNEEVEAGLIVVPPSLKFQWARKLEEFAPGSHVSVINGTPSQRARQYAEAAEWAEYIILGYSQVVDDWKEVRALPRDFVVCDEVQAIKNPTAKRTKKIKKLQAPIKFGLTGQPLENRPEDVFHILEWLDPEVLGRFDIFDRTFVVRNRWGRPVRYKNLPLFRETLRDQVMIRYSRDDIKEQLPDQAEDTFVIAFDTPTKRLYKVIVSDLIEALESAAEMTRSFDLASYYAGRNEESAAERAVRGRIMARLTCARMVADHPALLRMSADLYDVTQVKGEAGALKAGSAYAHELKQRGLLDKIPASPPKFKETVETVRELLGEDEENKVVIFSTFKPTLTWLRDALKKDAKAVLFHGDVSARDKDAAIEAFNNDPEIRLFLSSDAGGSGVDLPSGNYLINYDLPFSAGMLEQRNARIDRIASEHESILVLNFLMEHSVEEFYYEVVQRRRRLARAVTDGKGADRSGSINFDTGSLLEFLIGSKSDLA